MLDSVVLSPCGCVPAVLVCSISPCAIAAFIPSARAVLRPSPTSYLSTRCPGGGWGQHAGTTAWGQSQRLSRSAAGTGRGPEVACDGGCIPERREGGAPRKDVERYGGRICPRVTHVLCFLFLLFLPAFRTHNLTVLPSHNSTFVSTNDSAYSNLSATVGEHASTPALRCPAGAHTEPGARATWLCGNPLRVASKRARSPGRGRGPWIRERAAWSWREREGPRCSRRCPSGLQGPALPRQPLVFRTKPDTWGEVC